MVAGWINPQNFLSDYRILDLVISGMHASLSPPCHDRIFPARHTITILIFGMPPKMAVGTAQVAAIVKTRCTWLRCAGLR